MPTSSKGSILELIGNTPLVRLGAFHANPRLELLAKLEGFNPGGSIKDRVALAMVEAAERSGELGSGKTIVEATSGNTGIGLAMVCAVKGYKLMLIMPESASEERKRIMAAYGAELYLTPGHLATDGAIEEAYRLAREEPERYVLMDQYNNPASIQAHCQGTAEEILEQTEGGITHAVCTLGTSGTAMGLAKRLKEYRAAIEVIAVEPYIGHKIQGLKNMQASYPPGIFDKQRLDRIVHVDDEEAFSLCRELAAREGIFAGMSSGAALGGALRLAEELDSGTVVVIFPDGGERYLSTSLFLPPAEKGLALYNLKTRQQDTLQADRSGLSVFTPGPSPDAPFDPEVWRRLVLTDVLARMLQERGVPCTAVSGLADLDDQALKQARASDRSLKDQSGIFVQSLVETSELLNMRSLEFAPASKREQGMLDMCRKLLSKGRAYEKLRSVYYDVFRDSEYGRLVRADLDKLSLGKTVDLESYAKDNPQDFTLLKRASLQDLKLGDFIKTEWGNVRPSWYLQMAAAPGGHLDSLELVVAGRQHQFPHLDNLRAIWSGALQLEPAVWMVVQSTEAEGAEGQAPDVHSLVRRFSSPLALRMWLLSISYRKPLICSDKNLHMWEHNWQRLQNLLASVRQVTDGGESMDKEVEQANFELRQGLSEALEDDLSLHRFWPVLFDFCKRINRRFSRGQLSRREAKAVLERVEGLDAVLGVVDWERLPLEADSWPEEIRQKVERRDRAKGERDFQTADRLRLEIAEAGYRLEDTPYGTRLFKR